MTTIRGHSRRLSSGKLVWVNKHARHSRKRSPAVYQVALLAHDEELKKDVMLRYDIQASRRIYNAALLMQEAYSRAKTDGFSKPIILMSISRKKRRL